MIFLFLLKDVLYEQIFNLLPQIKKRKIKKYKWIYYDKNIGIHFFPIIPSTLHK